jgi:hypothetical protein
MSLDKHPTEDAIGHPIVFELRGIEHTNDRGNSVGKTPQPIEKPDLALALRRQRSQVRILSDAPRANPEIEADETETNLPLARPR